MIDNMRFTALLSASLPGNVVLRPPTVWERLQRAFLASPALDLSTEDRQLRLDLLRVTEGICSGLREAGVTDAVMLAVDGRTAYHDPAGIPNDADILLLGAQAEQLRGGFQELRVVFSHREGDLQALVEATVRHRFHRDSPAAHVAVSGRFDALRPQPGEADAAARERVLGLLQQPDFTAGLHQRFSALVERARDGLARAFPDAEVKTAPVQVRLQRPGRGEVSALAGAAAADLRPRLRDRPRCYHTVDPSARIYDPWACYFVDLADVWTSLTELARWLQTGSPPAFAFPVPVVDAAGGVLCEVAELPAHLGAFTGVAEAAALDLSSAARLSELSYPWPDFTPAPDVSLPGIGGAGEPLSLVPGGIAIGDVASALLPEEATTTAIAATIETVGTDVVVDSVGGFFSGDW